METLPAVYIIFTLLNAFRRGVSRKDIWKEFRRQGIKLRPRLSFWLAVCREAHLLSGDEKIIVTRFAPQWLCMPPEAQTRYLLEAWQNAPKNSRERKFRKNILWKLKWDKALTQKDLRAISGIEALGLYHASQLTAWGKLIIKEEGMAPTPKPAEAWQFQAERLIANIASQTDLLWELEKYLRPSALGKYPLTACHQGDPQDLISLLERGAHKKLPDYLMAKILSQPSIRIQDGAILEFSHPADLKNLRRLPSLRQHFESLLSPRHVFISAKNSGSLVQILKRRHIHLALNEEQPLKKKKRTHFTQKTLLQPAGKSVSITGLLEKYMYLQQAVDILYRAPGYPVEQRRITPLSIEQRGGHTYIIAYCHASRPPRPTHLPPGSHGSLVLQLKGAPKDVLCI